MRLVAVAVFEATTNALKIALLTVLALETSLFHSKSNLLTHLSWFEKSETRFS